jgi:adenosylcobinamide-phosphate synthase
MEIVPVAWHTLAAALIMDLIFGDPRWLPHPVRWMGTAIIKLEPLYRKHIPALFWGGLLFAISLILGTWLLGVIAVKIASILHPVAAFFLETILLFYCLSARSLATEAKIVLNHLSCGHVDQARERLRLIVGRDVKNLDEAGISRATVETVAENLVDGFISPLFFAAVGGVPLALAYKMTNTLDSMVGYKNETYGAFGKAAARIDDAANFIPARISVGLIVLCVKLFSGRWRQAFMCAWREGGNHSSPNAGYPEAAFAGALGIKLGGPNLYQGQLVDKPFIGAGYGEANPLHIENACNLMLLVSLLWVAVLCFATVL